MQGKLVMDGSCIFFDFAFTKSIQNSRFSAEESGISNSGSSF